MSNRIEFAPMNIFAKIAVAFVSFMAVLCCAYAAEQISVTARSGEQLPCHTYYRVDAKGKEWPVTIQFTARPKNGSVTTQSFARPVSVNGEAKTVRAVRVFYTSKKGYVGQDSFTYRRITADPTDPESGKEFTVAVTVR
jgi:hypothetical protein